MPRRWLVALLLVLYPFGVAAESTPERPKIGLALSGGGAKGCAHVGVLRVLEELQIPVDYIAGTSMGSIVGGLYASGMTVDELETMLVSVDWSDAFQDAPRREDLSFRRKEDDQRYLFDLELGLREGRLVWPTGLIGGQKLFYLLRTLTLPASGIDDFDRLPIPFRAVATDIETGEMVVLDHGDLARALRASMAIPGAFAAVDLDGRRLVDGGVVNNLPVDIVRAMGADIVIAVDLGTPIAERGEMQSMVQIVSQTTGMITRSNVRLRLPDADLVLNPPVQEYGVMEFEQAAAIIQAGLVEARAHAEDLKAHAIAADDFAAHTAARPAPPPVPTTLEFVTFRGNERVDDRIIEARLDLQPGQPLDLTAIEANLGRLFGLGDFSAVEMALETRTADDGMIEHGVVLDLVEKDWGPNYLRGGLTLESGFEGEGLDFGLLVNLTMTHLNARAGEWRNDLRVGRQQLLLSELYQPLDFGGRFFVAPSLRLLQTRVGFFEDGVETSELDVEQDVAQVDFGFQGKHYGEIRIGVFRGLLDFEVGVGAADGGPAGSVDLGGLVFRARLDRLDNAAIPRRGTAFDLNILRSMSDLGGDDEYTKASLTASAFGSFGHHTIFGAVELGTSPDGMLPVYDQFFAGGILSFSGFQPNELTGQALGIGRLGYYRDIGQASFGVIDSVVAGGWVEVGNVWEEEDDFGEDLIVAGGVMLGADTAFGPMYLAYGRAETGDDQLYLSVGTTF